MCTFLQETGKSQQEKWGPLVTLFILYQSEYLLILLEIILYLLLHMLLSYLLPASIDKVSWNASNNSPRWVVSQAYSLLKWPPGSFLTLYWKSIHTLCVLLLHNVVPTYLQLIEALWLWIFIPRRIRHNIYYALEGSPLHWHDLYFTLIEIILNKFLVTI